MVMIMIIIIIIIINKQIMKKNKKRIYTEKIITVKYVTYATTKRKPEKT